MAEKELDTRVAAVRRFNRFYTRQIGVLQKGYLASPFSLAEARVIYELAQRTHSTATELGNMLGLDPGYLSRMLSDFAKRGLISKKPSPDDKRTALVMLTRRGRDAYQTLNARSHEDIGAMLKKLAADDQQRVVRAMDTIELLLGESPERRVPYILRPPQPGDMGWVVRAHGALYAQEYGWNEQFEALVAGIVAKFVEHYDPRWERCWIAEVDGEPVGSVFVVKKSRTVAKLRLLIVDPRARGLGIGARLVDECIQFARRAGYRRMVLWTNSVLTAARHIYVQAGFQLTEEEAHHSFGHDLVGETWELEL